MSVRIREWASRPYFDPAFALREMRKLERHVVIPDLPDIVRRLRTGRLKEVREARTAALFAHGLGKAFGVPFMVSPGETEDADFILRRTLTDQQSFTGVQLKELVPDDLNPNQTLEALVASLQGLPQSDSVCLIYLNRRSQLSFDRLASVRVPFAELWYLWSSSPDANTWGLLGDGLTNPRVYEFQYPA